MRSVDLETDRQMEKQTGVKILFTMTYIINKPLYPLQFTPFPVITIKVRACEGMVRRVPGKRGG